MLARVCLVTTFTFMPVVDGVQIDPDIPVGMLSFFLQRVIFRGTAANLRAGISRSTVLQHQEAFHIDGAVGVTGHGTGEGQADEHIRSDLLARAVDADTILPVVVGITLVLAFILGALALQIVRAGVIIGAGAVAEGHEST